jgi:hypothetical protein
MEVHAKYSPSKLSRILACAASADAIDVKGGSVYADEGTMLHGVTEAGLQAFVKGQSWMTTIRGFILNREQLNAVEECMLFAVDKVTELGGLDQCKLFIEQRFYIADDCDGTADLTIVGPDDIHVIDWKFGQGIEVSAHENTQLMAYGWGAVKDLGQTGNYHLPVNLHVVQPRLNNFSSFETSVGELDRWVKHVLLPGLARAGQPNPSFNPSIETCRWCPRKQTCSARLQGAMKNAELVFAEHANLPDVPLDALQRLIPMAKEIEQVIKDLTLLAHQQLANGKEVAGYKLVRGRSNRAWVDVEAAGEYLSLHLEPEEMFNVTMVSPAVAEGLLDRARRKEDDFTSLIHKPEGKVTLALESDKRPAISLDASSVFADVVGTTEEE